MMGSPCASISTLPHEHRATMRLFGVVGMSLLRPLPPIAIGTDYPHERLTPTRGLLRTPYVRSSENFPSRDCLETPKGLHYGVSRACGTGQKGTIWTLRATGKRAIRPAQRVSRQSLEGLFSEVRSV